MDSLQETLELLSAPGFREGFDIARKEAASGDTVSFEEAFGEEDLRSLEKIIML